MRTKEVINILKNQSDKFKYAAIIGTTLLIAVDANGFVRKGNKKGMAVCREYLIILWDNKL